MYDIRNLNIWKSEDPKDGPLSASPSISVSYPGGAADIYTGSRLADMGIDELNLSVRAYNCLKRAGCSTIGDILRLAESSENGLMRIRNLGAKSAKEILDKIEEMQAQLLQQEGEMPAQNPKKLIRPSRKMLDMRIDEFDLSQAAKTKLKASGICIARDLYRGGAFPDPGWFAVRELFEKLQSLC